MQAELPLVDISALHSSDEEAHRLLAKTIYQACSKNGFMYVSGHGISEELISRVFQASKSFFDLSESEKSRYDMRNSICNRGYDGIGNQRLQADAQPDLKESFFLGRDLSLEHPMVVQKKMNHGPNQWPHKPDNFQLLMQQYMDELSTLGAKLMSALALSLDLPQNYFVEAFQEPMINLRLLHYPAQAPSAPEDELGCGAHTDFGAITLLMQDDTGGLEIWDDSRNMWLSAEPKKDCFIINLGDMIARWTNDIYKSTQHRVINRKGRDRYSIAFFYNGHHDHLVECLPTCIQPEGAAKYPAISIGDHIREMYAATYS